MYVVVVVVVVVCMYVNKPLDEHPEYVMVSSQARKEHKRRLGHAGHLMELESQNAIGLCEAQVKMAHETYEVRRTRRHHMIWSR